MSQKKLSPSDLLKPIASANAIEAARARLRARLSIMDLPEQVQAHIHLGSEQVASDHLPLVMCFDGKSPATWSTSTEHTHPNPLARRQAATPDNSASQDGVPTISFTEFNSEFHDDRKRQLFDRE